MVQWNYVAETIRCRQRNLFDLNRKCFGFSVILLIINRIFIRYSILPVKIKRRTYSESLTKHHKYYHTTKGFEHLQKIVNIEA